MEIIRLTKELVNAGRSVNGFFSQEQIETLGYTWPQHPAKFNKEILGHTVSISRYEEFVALKDKHIAKHFVGEKIPKFHGGIKFNKDIWNKGVSSNGALFKAQYEVLKLIVNQHNTPEKGWKDALFGRIYNKSIIDEFIRLKDQHLLPKKKPKPSAILDGSDSKEIELTVRILERGRTKSGGYSLKQLNLIGVTHTKNNPRWRDEVVGKRFPIEIIEQFLDFYHSNVI